MNALTRYGYTLLVLVPLLALFLACGPSAQYNVERDAEPELPPVSQVKDMQPLTNSESIEPVPNQQIQPSGGESRRQDSATPSIEVQVPVPTAATRMLPAPPNSIPVPLVATPTPVQEPTPVPTVVTQREEPTSSPIITAQGKEPTPTPTPTPFCLDTSLPVGGDDGQFCFVRPRRTTAQYEQYASLGLAVRSADEYQERRAARGGSDIGIPRVMVRIFMETGVRSTAVKAWLAERGVPPGPKGQEAVEAGELGIYVDQSIAEYNLDWFVAIIPVTLVVPLTQLEGIDYMADERQHRDWGILEWQPQP